MTVELLHVDCMEYMATLPDNAFELAITDPPYGIGQAGDKNKTRSRLSKDYKPFHGGDKSPPPVEYFQELERVSRNQIIWGGNHMADLIGKRSSCWLVWDKFTNGHFADCELAYTSFKSAVRIFRFLWSGYAQADMKNKEYRIHPTQKPVKLYNWILKNYAKPGDRILDTHLGSGSSAIAAHYAGFDFVGCELDEDYYSAACERFKNQTAQMAMQV